MPEDDEELIKIEPPDGGGHVNAGPPGHANGGGHANFDPPGGHVNSGPPGHANQPGHANFDPPGGHVNSGPPGHANQPGHANFDPGGIDLGNILTLPDGLVLVALGNSVVVHVPGGGRVTLPTSVFRDLAASTSGRLLADLPTRASGSARFARSGRGGMRLTLPGGAVLTIETT